MNTNSHSVIGRNEMAYMNALIVDDEIEACLNLEYLLKEIAPDFIIKGLAHNTTEAEQFIRELQPDVVFLDIDMPKENAFDFLERIAPVRFEVVFVTAYDAFAVRAFKLNAVDYVLKPVDANDLSNAVLKVRERIKYKQRFLEDSDAISQLKEEIRNRVVPNQIVLRDGGDLEIVPFPKLLFVEAQGSYSQIHYVVGKEERIKLMSHSISEYEELLPDDLFYRIHKSYLVNISHLQKIKKEEQPTVMILGKYNLPIGRRRYSQFLSFIKGNPLISDD